MSVAHRAAMRQMGWDKDNFLCLITASVAYTPVYGRMIDDRPIIEQAYLGYIGTLLNNHHCE